MVSHMPMKKVTQLILYAHNNRSIILLRCMLLFGTIVGIYMVIHGMKLKERPLVQYPNELHFGHVQRKDATQIAMLVSGIDSCHQAFTMLKSLLLALGRFNRTAAQCAPLLEHYWIASGTKVDAMRAIELHLIVDHQAHNRLFEQFSAWKPRQFAIHFYAIEQYMDMVENLASAHYSGSRSYLKLLLPQILPNSVENVIMLDVDMLLATSIHSLWAFFDQFNQTQAIGMVQEQNPFFWTFVGRYYWPDLGYGYNAGLILLNLQKLRQSNWTALWQDVYDNLLRNIGRALPTAEQDVLNRIAQLDRGILFDIPCEWNVQLAAFSRTQRCPITWPFTETGHRSSRGSSVKQANLLHFNVHFKPESVYPKPWQTPHVADDGHSLSKIERARKFFKFYYLLREAEFFCFD